MVSEAVLDSLRQAFAAGRPANGYIVLGPVRSEGTQLAEWLGRHLLGDLPTVAEHTHPDMPWFEPVKKSRVIDVETMKEKILPFLQQTSLSGGWKIAVIVSADRMNSAAANAFLKTLEEPAPKTVSLLLADSPDDFLPTIVSRCQVIQAGGDRRLPEPWRTRVLGLLAREGRKGVWEAACLADGLCAVLDDMTAAAEKEVTAGVRANDAVDTDKDVLTAMVAARAKALRAELFLTVEQWMGDLIRLRAGGGEASLRFPEYRSVLAVQAARHPLARLLDNPALLDTLQTWLERNIPPAQILPYWTDRFYL